MFRVDKVEEQNGAGDGHDEGSQLHGTLCSTAATTVQHAHNDQHNTGYNSITAVRGCHQQNSGNNVM